MSRLDELPGNYTLTPHAQRAAQQRGIKLQPVQCVLYNTDVRNHRGEGKMSFAISKKKMKQLRSQGYPSKIIEGSSSIVVLGEPMEKKVISVWHSCRKSNRRDYKQNRTYSVR